MSPELLDSYVDDSHLDLLVLTTSHSHIEENSLNRAYHEIAAICRRHNVGLLFAGAEGAPEDLDYGYRCQNFVEFDKVMEQIDLHSNAENRLAS